MYHSPLSPIWNFATGPGTKKEVEDPLDSFHATRVLHDTPASKNTESLNSPFVYLHFHGPAGDAIADLYTLRALSTKPQFIADFHK